MNVPLALVAGLSVIITLTSFTYDEGVQKQQTTAISFTEGATSNISDNPAYTSEKPLPGYTFQVASPGRNLTVNKSRLTDM